MKFKVLGSICFIVICSVFVMSSVGYAGESYFSVNGGIAMFDDTTLSNDDRNIESELRYTDIGSSISVAIGGKLTDNIRGETEIGYQWAGLDSSYNEDYGEGDLTGDVSAITVMLNGYFDFLPGRVVTPFIFTGAGVARIDMGEIYVYDVDASIPEDDDTVLAYQFGAGISFPIMENRALDIKYRYFAVNEFDWGAATADLTTHSLVFGGRFLF